MVLLTGAEGQREHGAAELCFVLIERLQVARQGTWLELDCHGCVGGAQRRLTPDRVEEMRCQPTPRVLLQGLGPQVEQDRRLVS